MALTKNPTYIHEPTPLQCGQAVLAMLADVTVDEIINLVGTERETDLKQMFKSLEHYGINYKRERKAVCKKEELPKAGIAEDTMMVVSIMVLGTTAIFALKKVNDYKNI